MTIHIDEQIIQMEADIERMKCRHSISTLESEILNWTKREMELKREQLKVTAKKQEIQGHLDEAKARLSEI